MIIKLYLVKKYLLKIVYCFYYHSLIQAKWLIDLTGVDYPGAIFRFHIHYLLLSLTYNLRLQLIIQEKDWHLVDSITEFYFAANWAEREVWDLYGVPFKAHPDLRRILTDYGFKGHPLRKNFPLSGYNEIFYDDAQKLILIEPIELAQEYRRFTFKF